MDSTTVLKVSDRVRVKALCEGKQEWGGLFVEQLRPYLGCEGEITYAGSALVHGLVRVDFAKTFFGSPELKDASDHRWWFPPICLERVQNMVTGSNLKVGDRVRVSALCEGAPEWKHHWIESLRTYLNCEGEVSSLINGMVSIAFRDMHSEDRINYWMFPHCCLEPVATVELGDKVRVEGGTTDYFVVGFDNTGEHLGVQLEVGDGRRITVLASRVQIVERARKEIPNRYPLSIDSPLSIPNAGDEYELTVAARYIAENHPQDFPAPEIKWFGRNAEGRTYSDQKMLDERVRRQIVEVERAARNWVVKHGEYPIHRMLSLIQRYHKECPDGKKALKAITMTGVRAYCQEMKIDFEKLMAKEVMPPEQSEKR